MYIKPTDSELEILNFLWFSGPSTVKDVHKHLAERKGVGYTTALKLMQIMHDKGLLYRTERGRSHIYVALLGKEETQQNLTKRLIQTAYQDSPYQMVLQILENHTFSKEEREQIRTILDESDKNS